jgi:CRISPR/Cas system-associated exonuclease Cas4 (RecB family)
MSKKVKVEPIGMGKIETAFMNKFDEFIMKKQIDEVKPDIKRHRPSGYFGCIRQKYYDLLDTPREAVGTPSGQSVRWLENGKVQHSWVQEAIILKYQDAELRPYDITKIPSYGKELITIERDIDEPLEVKFVDNRWTMFYPLAGKVDGVLELNGMPFILEIKTAKAEKFREVTETGVPLDYHIWQGAAYSLALELPVMYLYYNKDNQDMYPILYNFSQEEYDYVINKISRLEGFIASEDLPPQEGSFMDCKDCSFKKRCWKAHYLEEWKKNKGIKR